MIAYKNSIVITYDTSIEKLMDFQKAFVVQHKIPLSLMLFSDVLPTWEEETLYLLYLEDAQVKAFLKNYRDAPIAVGLLPHDRCPQTTARYGLVKDMYEALDDVLNTALRVADQILLCNGEVVFHKVSIGNVQNLNKKVYDLSFAKNVQNFFNHLKNLSYLDVSLKTAKENLTHTVASGVLVLEDYVVFHALKKSEKVTFHDGKLNAFIIAPNSLLSYVYDLIAIYFYHKFSWGSLPKSIGYISSASLLIEGTKPFDFTIDEVPLSAKSVELEIVPSVFSIAYGRSFATPIAQREEPTTSESVNIKNLPKGEIRELLIKGHVPLLKKASDEDMKETLSAVKESAKTSSIFLTLMILSTLLATVGLFQDSTPSVIGAMILAPLMAPIISLSMGLARSDRWIIKNALFTLLLGTASALLFSAFFTLMLPIDMSTSQMRTRIDPNLLDLFIAIFSGMAGAYATAKEEVAKSLAGVAIAVALVPPLAVAGIGIGWGDMSMIYGASLLYLTNLFGMIVAASLTFIVLGFAPINRAKKGLIYSIGMVTLVSIPLGLSFHTLILQSHDHAKLRQLGSIAYEGTTVDLNIISVTASTRSHVTIETEVLSPMQLQDGAFAYVQALLEEKMGKKVRLVAIPKIVINTQTRSPN